MLAVWGIGLGGGYVAAFDLAGISPAWMLGARGFWSMASVGLATAGIAMSAYLAVRLRREASPSAPAGPAPPSRRAGLERKQP